MASTHYQNFVWARAYSLQFFKPEIARAVQQLEPTVPHQTFVDALREECHGGPPQHEPSEEEQELEPDESAPNFEEFLEGLDEYFSVPYIMSIIEAACNFNRTCRPLNDQFAMADVVVAQRTIPEWIWLNMEWIAEESMRIVEQRPMRASLLRAIRKAEKQIRKNESLERYVYGLSNHPFDRLEGIPGGQASGILREEELREEEPVGEEAGVPEPNVLDGTKKRVKRRHLWSFSSIWKRLRGVKSRG